MRRLLIFLPALLSLVSPLRAVADDEIAPPAKRKIDFHKDVVPILYRSCTKCHTGDSPKGGLRMETRAQLLAGGDSGKVVVPGDSAKSELIALVSGRDEDRVMPAQGPRLTAEQVNILRAWVDQGLTWEEGFRFGSTSSAPLAPRAVKLPPPEAADGRTHPVDRLLAPYFKQHGVQPGEIVSDRLFARRVYLDLVGLLPPPEAIAELESDTRPDKRARLIDKLLADDEAYALHWLTFWNDALRNAYRGTGYIDGGRKQITAWLVTSLYENKPYDQFVHQLIDPVPGSEGFIKGIVWRGVVNASQRPEMQAVQNVSQVFLGTNLKCASCHDSFINDWKLSDSYGLAAVFAGGPLEIHRCNKPIGEMAKVGFIYPQLGRIDASAPRDERMRQLADIVVKPQNGRLARTMVNRLWAQLLGRGIVEPVDDMDQPPLSRDLLDWLAADFAAHDFDVKHTLRLLCTSRAYQLPAVGAPRPEETDFVFRGPLVKRMTAEQFVDAVSTLTGVWPNKAAAKLPPLPDRSADANEKEGGKRKFEPPPMKAKWIWNDPAAARATAGGRTLFRRVVELPDRPRQARAVLTCDNGFTLWLNGRPLASSENWQQPVAVDLSSQLQAGKNVIAIEAVNFPARETGQGLKFSSPNPAGLIFVAAVDFKDGQRRGLIRSDHNWRWSKKTDGKWTAVDYDDGSWENAHELADATGGPWKAADSLTAAWKGDRAAAGLPSGGRRIRAALLNDDPLTRALGRTNREQVVTRRDTLATTLQALELTNGSTLDAKLNAGARNWHTRDFQSAEELVDQLYLTALGRQPTKQELRVAVELVGSPATQSGIADLLWAVAMLPEFQLVH